MHHRHGQSALLMSTYRDELKNMSRRESCFQIDVTVAACPSMHTFVYCHSCEVFASEADERAAAGYTLDYLHTPISVYSTPRLC